MDTAKNALSSHQPNEALKRKKESTGKLLCCFDGTGNQFLGDTSDTNIVKLYQKFDRNAPDQFHYYQRKPTLKQLIRTDTPVNAVSGLDS